MAETTNIRLVSDFRDWYDFAFSREGLVFRRVTTDGPSRPEMLAALDAWGVPTPRHGRVCDVVDRVLAEARPPAGTRDLYLEAGLTLVVYLDERAHRGDGKALLVAKEALRLYPDFYCTEYLPPAQPGKALSLRYLRIGRRAWWLRYENADPNEWRSNVGDGAEATLLGETDLVLGIRGHPLYAVDFVPTARGLLAIDFNVAPGLRWTGLEKTLRPSEVYQLIAEALAHSGSPR